MKVSIAERIQLHKLGYTREDIEAMINEPEQEPVLETVSAPLPDVPEPVQGDTNPAILAALNDIKTQLQTMAVMNSSAPGLDTQQSTFDILNNLINNKKE